MTSPIGKGRTPDPVSQRSFGVNFKWKRMHHEVMRAVCAKQQMRTGQFFSSLLDQALAAGLPILRDWDKK